MMTGLCSALASAALLLLPSRSRPSYRPLLPSIRHRSELARLWQVWLADPETAKAVGGKAADLLAANRGAVERTLKLVEPLMPD